MDELEFGFIKVLSVDHQSFAEIVLDFSLLLYFLTLHLYCSCI